MSSYYTLFFFFFQAEDGIRDTSVTGVQTCALPIYESGPTRAREPDAASAGGAERIDAGRLSLARCGRPHRARDSRPASILSAPPADAASGSRARVGPDS